MEKHEQSALRGRQTLPDLFQGQAERCADAVAIAAPRRLSLSYGRLRLQLDEIGKALGQLSVANNDRIAVVVPNGPEMAVAFLAVASFATCAPLNPAYQFNEFDFYLSDLKPRALIVQSGMFAPAARAAQKHAIPVVELTPAKEGPAGIFSLTVTGTSSKLRAVAAKAEDNALVLHTSGTTAQPKMVALTQRQLLASAANIAAGLELSGDDRCLNLMPLFHIHGLVGALLASCVTGASVVCTGGFDEEEFLQWLDEFAPSWYTAVPTIHQAVLSSAKAKPGAVEKHPLRLIRSCSAPLPGRLALELEGTFRVPVIEAYGMTEAAHQIASNPLPPKERKLGSVGLPSGSEIAVIDDQRRFVSQGEVGEIVIRGETVITGYANGPSAHEESFTNGWFRTGDQGYLDGAGYLYLTGRLKEIINRGGEKISPLEIEQALLSQPEIAQAAAFRVPHPTLGEDVAAVLVLQRGSRLTPSAVREYLLDRIAAYKVPGKILIVDEIPKGATGKVSRSELSARFTAETPEELTRIKNDLEESVAGIYREVLGAKNIAPGDNFFDLGGDSLRATQVINRVRALFEVNLSIATIFRKATVAELAGEIVQMLDKEADNRFEHEEVVSASSRTTSHSWRTPRRQL